MNKFISKVMVLVFAFSAILPVFAPSTVLANTIINVHSATAPNSGLGGGTTSPGPINVPTLPVAEQSQLHMSFPTGGGTNGFYRLSYYITDTSRVTLEVTRFNTNVLDVTYLIEVEQPTGSGTWVPVIPNYNVWHFNQQAWLPIATYLTTSFTETQNFRVLNGRWDNVEDPGLLLDPPVPSASNFMWPTVGDAHFRPSFRITSAPGVVNNGFSFQYGGRTIHIRYDGNMFHYAANNFESGSIYNMTIETGQRTGTGAAPTIAQYIITSTNQISIVTGGPAEGTINVIPFSNVGANGPNRALTIESPVAPHTAYGTTRITVNNTEYVWRAINRRFATQTSTSATWQPTPDDIAGRWPASPDEDSGLILQFAAPTYVGATPPSMPNITAGVNFGSALGAAYDIEFTLTNIFGNIAIAPISTAANFSVTYASYDNGVITVVIEDVRHSNFFGLGGSGGRPATIGFGVPQGSPNAAVPRPTNTNAHTFLHFLVHQLGDFILVPEPYAVAGTYVLHRYTYVEGQGPIIGIGPAEISRVHHNPSSGEELTFSIFPPAVGTAGSNFVYRIYFMPGGQITTAAAGANWVRSQHLVFNRDPEAVSITTPRSFNATYVRHVPRDILGHYGLLDALLDWDLGDHEDISIMFAQNAVLQNGYYTFFMDYRLEWSESPEHIGFNDMVGSVGVRAIIRLAEAHAQRDTNGNLTLTTLRNNSLTVAGGGVGLNATIEHVFTSITPEPSTAQPTVVGRNITNPPHNATIELVTGSQPLSPASGGRLQSNFLIRANTYHSQHASAAPSFRFPYIYLFRATPIGHSNRNANGNYLRIQGLPSSEFSAVTISEFDNMVAPPPQGVAISREVTTSVATGGESDRVSFDLQWTVPAQAIRDFLQFSYGLTGTASLEMTLYISQDESLLTGDFLEAVEEDIENSGIHNPSANFMFDRHAMSTVIPFNSNFLHQNDWEHTTHSIFFSNLNNSVGMTIPNSNAPARDALRNGDIVAITGITLDSILGSGAWNSLQSPTGESVTISLTLDGLDPNQRYYIFTDIIITQTGTELGTGGNMVPVTIKDASMISSLVGTTTIGQIQIPDGSDQNPSAPTPINTTDVGLDTATIYWPRVPAILVLEPGYTERIEYEIIRMRDRTLTQAQMNHTGPLNLGAEGNTFWNTIVSDLPVPEGIRAFKTSRVNQNAYEWDVLHWNGSNFVPGSYSIYAVPAPTENAAMLPAMGIRDNTLTGNTVYYYYVRTVRIVTNAQGEEISRRFSVFNHATVTTTLTERPEDLQIMLEAPVDWYTQAAFRFLAPIDSLYNIRNENLFVQYRLQVDNGNWSAPVRLQSSVLVNQDHQSNPVSRTITGTTRTVWYQFQYQITTGIVPGSIHNLQVRMVQVDASGSHVYSLWSDTATWLSQPDLEQDEIDREVRDWTNHIREELYRKLRTPYWVMRNDMGGYSVILRPSMFEEMMRPPFLSGSQIVLPFNMAPQTNFYIPASAFARAHQAELGFTIVADTMEIVIPHATIDINNNAAILQVNDAIRRNQLEDYLVRISVSWSMLPNVHGEQTITPVADINISVLAANINLTTWETLATQDLLYVINQLTYVNNIQHVVDAIRDDATIPLDIARYVLDILDIAEMRFLNTIGRNFINYVPAPRAPLTTGFDRAIMIRATTGDGTAAVTAYQFVAGLWAVVATTFDNGSGIIASMPGQFVFTGRVISIPGIEGTPGQGQAIGIVARHGLDDFFGPGVIDINQIATRAMLIDSVARIAGAPRGIANSNAWLRDNGIILPPGAGPSPIQTQEALHLVMIVYEVQTGTRAETIRITNFAITNNLQGLNPAFTTTFRAAIEIGLYRQTNIQPTSSITIGELLNVLTALDSLIGL